MTRSLLARGAELDTLGATVAAVQAERGAVVIIQGPAGIGKTALLDATCDLASAQGVLVLRARASELDRDFAHGVMHQLFEPPLVAADEEERARLLGGAAASAAFLVPGRGAEPVGGFAALHGLYWLALNLAVRGPVLLAVDDLHWTDVASLRLLEHLARRSEGTAIGLVATTRPAEPGAAQAVLDELVAGPSTQVLRPAPLGEGAVSTLLEAALGARPEPEFAAAAARATGGNPLLTTVLAREAAAGGLHGLASEEHRLGDLGGSGVEPIVRRQLRTLGPACERLARGLAVAGSQIGTVELAALVALEPAEALDAREELVRGAVLDAGTGEFVHPLVRAAVIAACPPSERARLHAALAQRLRASGAPPAQIAVHLLQSAPVGDPGTVEVLRAAARSAAGEGAPESAADLLERALSEPPPAALRRPLTLELGELELRVGRLRGAGRLRTLVAEGLSGDDAARAHVALGNQLVHSDPVAALDELERAATDARDPQLALQLEAHVLEALIFADTFAQRRDARIDAGARDPEASPAMLAHVAVDRACRGRPATEVLAYAERAASTPAQRARLGPASSTWNLLTHAMRYAGAADEGRLLLSEGERQAQQQGLHEALLFVEHGWGYWHRDFGSVATGAARAAAGLDVIRQLGMELTVPALAAITAENLVHCDQLDEAATHIEIPLDHIAGTYVEPFALSARAYVRLAARRFDEAEHDLRHLVEIGEARGWEAPHATRARLRLVAVLAHTGRTEEALAVSDVDVAAAEVVGLPGVTGMVLRARAQALSGDEGIETLETAVAALRASPQRLDLGWALHDLGARLRARGDRRDARVPLREAHELATATESSRLARHVGDELRATGSRLQRERTEGLEGLTPSERRVADLAAEGLTNREIAQSLWVVPKTVEMHLGRVYGKLGIRSRRELTEALGQVGVG